MANQEKVDRAVERLKSQTSQKGGIIKGLVINAKDLDGAAKSVKEVGVINHLVFSSGDPIGSMGSLNIKEADIKKLRGERLPQLLPNIKGS